MDADLIRAMRETCRHCGDVVGDPEDPNECPVNQLWPEEEP